AFPVRLELVVDQVVRVHVADEHDVSAAPPVAAIRAAPGFVFLPPETDTAAPTIPCRQLDCAFIDEHSVHDAEARAFAKGCDDTLRTRPSNVEMRPSPGGATRFTDPATSGAALGRCAQR